MHRGGTLVFNNLLILTVTLVSTVNPSRGHGFIFFGSSLFLFHIQIQLLKASATVLGNNSSAAYGKRRLIIDKILMELGPKVPVKPVAQWR